MQKRGKLIKKIEGNLSFNSSVGNIKGQVFDLGLTVVVISITYHIQYSYTTIKAFTTFDTAKSLI